MSVAIMRTAKVEDISVMLDWAAAEGWNPGLDDAQAFLAADPCGFFVADVNNAPVASISVVNHSDDFAFLGLYICRAEFRGRGIGYALWNHALRYAGSRTVGLDGVAAQEPNYAKSGFLRQGATIRFVGRLSPETTSTIREVRADDLHTLIGIDAEANGYKRQNFIENWLTDTGDRRTVVLTENDQAIGFATIRSCKTGVKVGPLVARHAKDGMALMRSAVSRLPTSGVIVDVPSGNTEFIDLLKHHGFVETFRTARMYRGQPPVQTNNLLGIGTMELG